MMSILKFLGLENFGRNELIALVIIAGGISIGFLIKGMLEKRNKKRNESENEKKAKGGEGNNKGIAFSEVLVVLALLFCLFAWFMHYKKYSCCPCGPVTIIEEEVPKTPEQVLYKEAP